jgi:hypothetical protein
MNFSSLLGGAGVAGVAMRKEEEAQRTARDNQLKLEALNREDLSRRELLKNMSGMPEFGAPPTGSMIDVDALGRKRYPVAPAPVEAAPQLPIPQAEPRVPENRPPPPEGYYKKITQQEFLMLDPAERKRRLDLYNAQETEAYSKAMSSREEFAKYVAAKKKTGFNMYNVGENAFTRVAPEPPVYTEDDFLLTLPSNRNDGPQTRGRGFRKRAGLVAPTPGMAPELAGALGVGPLQVPDSLAGLTDKADNIYQRRSSQVPQALQSPFIQSLIQRAQQLGVNPAAAVTISALETGYGLGGTEATSGVGARGVMQVMPTTFASMKKWYTDPANIKQYNIPQKLVDAATNMQQSTPEGDVDGGLLRLKYNEFVGVPPELWGAAYQASAEQVRDAKRPLKASDGNITNDEYNSIYVNLYNQIATALGGVAPSVPGVTPPPLAPPPSLTPPAVAATPPAAAAGAPPAVAATPPAAAAGTGPATQLVAPRGGVNTSGVKSPSAFYIGRPDVVAYERKNLDSMFDYQRQMMIATYKAEMTAGRPREAQAIAAQIMNIDQGYKTGRLLLDGRAALDILEYQNDPRPVASVLSTFRGQDVNFQPVQNGTYNMFIGNQNVGNYSATEISELVKEYTDAEWVKARNASASKVAELRFTKGLETQGKLLEANATMIRESYLEAIKGNNAIRTELAKQTGIKLLASGDTVYVYSEDGKTIGTIDPRTGQVVDMDGVKVPLAPLYRPSQSTPR